MARSSKLSVNKKPVDPPSKLLEIILDDVINTASMPFEDWLALSPNSLVPLSIPVDLTHQYQVTQTAVDAAHRLTAQAWDQQLEFRQTIERGEFDKISFRAIGETIRDCHSHLPVASSAGNQQVGEEFYGALAADYASNLKRLADASRPTLNRHIPCHLFHDDQAVPAFTVGPVDFLPRPNWVARYVTNPSQLKHVQQFEEGNVSYDELRTHALSNSSDRDLHTAWQIVGSLRNFHWIATIRMEGHESSMSHRKASIIVGLALDAIGLRFQVEDARRFTKAGRQHLFSEDRLATSDAGNFLKGWSAQMPGLGSRPKALAGKMQAEKPFLDAAGKLLYAYVQGRQVGKAPHLIERWVNALYWVGGARRESSDFMAIVDYGCAADVLSGAGGEASAMTAFAEAALNPKGQQPPAGMMSVADAVNKVYREGRNKLAHGEMSGLLEDLSETRTVGDALLVNLFDPVTFEIANILDQRPAILELQEKHAYRALGERLKQRT